MDLADPQIQYIRSGSLIISRSESVGNNPSAYRPPSTLDMSELRFTFKTTQQDVESPNNCVARVYNLSEATVKQATNFGYDRLILRAGYGADSSATGGTGIVFDGTIKQFRIGRENATDTYLEILAADGDLVYNFATVGVTLAAGSTPRERISAILDEMGKAGASRGYEMNYTGGTLPRGKVLFGMARVAMRQQAASQLATWGISNGKIDIVPLKGYKPGEAVVLTAQTGLVGLPEQTQEGVRATCLLNPRLETGSLFKIDNKSVNRTMQRNGSILPAPAFNSYRGIQNLAHVATDGLYRALVVEHEGDSRGQSWYTRLVGLAVNPVTQEVQPYG